MSIEHKCQECGNNATIYKGPTNPRIDKWFCKIHDPRIDQLKYKIPFAYLGKTPEAGTAKIYARNPKQAEAILQQMRPNAIIGKAYR